MRSNIALLMLTLCAVVVQAQPHTFSSGSSAADGALTLRAQLRHGLLSAARISPAPSNIYNFTTITIGAGTTVRVSGWVFSSPVVWLAQGDVDIEGTLDLSGQHGHGPGNPSLRAPSEPGAGGYSGGVATAGAGQNATAGNGPGGGQAAGFNASTPLQGGGGTFSGNNYLNPLLGGSGGGGAGTCAGCGGGGAGGGAILIASSTQIIIDGHISAAGGSGGIAGINGGGGSGGAIRLMSNLITNLACHGSVDVTGGGTLVNPLSNGIPSGGSGIVRFEAYTLSIVNNIFQVCSVAGTYVTSSPFNVSLPVGGFSTISVTSVNGTAINANPFSFPGCNHHHGNRGSRGHLRSECSVRHYWQPPHLQRNRTRSNHSLYANRNIPNHLGHSQRTLPIRRLTRLRQSNLDYPIGPGAIL